VKSIGNVRSLLVSCLVLGGAAAHAQTAQFSGAQVMLPIGTLTNPYGMAVDTSGNIYVADNADNALSKLTPSGALSAGFLTGDGSPYGVAVDGSGNLYITDSVRNEVVKETPGGSYTRSVLPLSGLHSPLGVAVDAHGNLYIADYLNNRVVKATPSGGTYTQSTVPTSTLSLPEAVAVDGLGNLYIADTFHLRVLKETPSGNSYSESVVEDLENSGGTARPIGVAADAAGDVFILNYLDDENFSVDKVTLSGGVYTPSSAIKTAGQNVYGIAADAAGDLYMVSPGTNRLLEVPVGPTTNFGPVQVGSTRAAISLTFTFATQSTLSSTAVLTQGAARLDFTDAGTGTCGRAPTGFVFVPGAICTVDVVFKPQVSGSRYGAAVLQDASGNALATAYIYGTGVAPQITFPPGKQVSVSSGLKNPSGVAVDALGNVFFAESGTGNVYKETVSLTAYARYSYSRTTIASGLQQPTGLALDGAGNIYVATPSLVYKEALSHGSYVQSKIVTDLTDLVGIAVDRSGNLYLTSSVVGNVHKETLQTNGSYTETAIGYGIVSPTGVAVDGSGEIFILSTKNGDLYTETLQANGSYLQTTVPTGIFEPRNLTVDGNGNLYLADPSHGEIDKLTLETNGGYVETIASFGLTEPSGLAVDGGGDLYYSQGISPGALTMIDVFDQPLLVFAATKPGLVSADSPKYQTIANVGNAALVFPVLSSGTNPSTEAPFALEGESTCPVVGVSGVAGSLDAGSSCVYGISFTPEIRASFSWFLFLLDNNLNSVLEGTEQEISLIGTGTTSDTTRTTMRVSPSPVKAGLGVTMTVTVSDTFSPATIAQGGVTFTDSVGGQAVSLNGGAAVALSNGKAVLTMVPSVAGAHTISAHYGGVDDSFLGSTGQATLTVQP
jgi:sugar lactone lactonase YvrE